MESTASGIRQRKYRAQDVPKRLAVGFFEKLWARGLEQCDELEGIGWEWKSLDGCMGSTD